MSVPEIIPLTKIQKYANNDIFVKKIPELSQSSQNSEELVVSPAYDISNKNACYLAALQNHRITQNNTGEMS